MKNIKPIYVILLFLGITISCTQEKDEVIVNTVEKTYPVGLKIKEILPLPVNLTDRTSLVTSNINYKELHPNINESFIISHEDCTLRTICTPLNQKLKSSTEIFHVYFEREGKVSKFDLLITVEKKDENTETFTYLTREGELIAKFDVGIDNGQISNTQVNNLKDWGDRFNNCVEAVLDSFNGIEKLMCMTASVACATTIAGACAVAATEGQFE
jgi:hypothetical protein